MQRVLIDAVFPAVTGYPFQERTGRAVALAEDREHDSFGASVVST